MQRRSNINLNSAGKLSCLLLLLVLGGVFCPLSSTSTYADEEIEGASSTSASTTSSVGIAFSNTEPSSGSISVNNTILPVKEENLTQANVLVTISAQKAKSYEVYLGSTSSDLVNKVGEEEYTIEGLTDADVSYESIPKNEWGYSVSTEKNVISDSYNRVPKTSETAHIIASNSNPSDIDPDYLTLSFAANIGNDMPSGTYSNTITLSVVSTPRELTNAFGITTMQEMTNAICNAAPGGAEAQLEDIRDGKFYWIGKIKSDTTGNYRCWMTQNLDLDLTAGDSKTLTAENSQTAYTPVYTTAKTVRGNQLADNAGQRSWSLGDYYLADSANSNNCGVGANDIETCKDKDDMSTQYVALATPTYADGDPNAHYLIGNHYQWNAATAGTGGINVTTGQASGSICPYGWRLPESNTTAVGSFGGLIGAGNVTLVSTLATDPYYFVTGGYVSPDADLYAYAGNRGDYWSSTPRAALNCAFRLSFVNDTNVISPSAYGMTRNGGLSIRCINNPNI